MKNPIAFSRRFMTFLSEKKRFEMYPPYWMMRLKVLEMSDNWERVRIRLPLTWVAKNMGGAMFGGFQASLADPIAPLACAKMFPEYHVWTRHLAVDFRLPGDSDLILKFDFPAELKAKIDNELKSKGRSTPTFTYGLYREDGKMCTEVNCVVAIRPKDYLQKLEQKA